MPKRPHTPLEEAEVIIDAESGDEIVPEETEVAAHGLQNKLKKLRDELKECQKERDNNLAGWQRSKADLVNYRRTVEEDRKRDTARAKGDVVAALIPVIDAFDSAIAAESWQQVDQEWRSGVERIDTQLHRALEEHGLESYGEECEAFDPSLHECMSVVPTDKKHADDSIVQVLQRGLRIDGFVLRPAKVVVAQEQ